MAYQTNQTNGDAMVKNAFESNGYIEIQPGVYENTEDVQKIDTTRIDQSLEVLISAVK